MIIAFTTWTWRPNSTSKEAYGWSYWFCPFGRSRVICLWIMQTRFISDAFIFILGKTCQILFYDVATSAGQLGSSIDFLTSCFFGLVQAIPNISQMNPNRNPHKFHTICLRNLFFRPNYLSLPPLCLTWTAVLQKWRMMKFNFWSKDQLTKKKDRTLI